MVSNYSKPIDTSGIEKGSQQGLSLGIDIAQRQQQMDMARKQLQFKQSQLQAQMDQHEYQLWGHFISAKDNPELQKAAGEEIMQARQQRGKPVNQTLMKVLSKGTDLPYAMNVILGVGQGDPNEILDTPEPLLQSNPNIPNKMSRSTLMTTMLDQMNSGTITEAVKLANDLTKHVTQKKIAEGAFNKTLLAQGLDPIQYQELYSRYLENPNDANAAAALARFLSTSKARQGIVQGQERVDQGQQRVDETGRHNKEQEIENRLKALETAQHNMNTESLGQKKANEASAHNQITEGQGQQKIDESGRHNKVGEGQGQQKVDETVAHDQATEGLGQQRVDETGRHNKIGEDQGQQKITETGRHNLSSEDIARQRLQLTKQRVGQTAQALALRGKQLSLSQQRLLETQESRIEQAPAIKKAQDSIQFADNALERLKPGMKWIDMYDSAADFNRLMTGNNRAAFQGEDRRTFTDVSATWSRWKGNIDRKETGGPSNEEIQIFRDRVESLRDAYTRQHDNVYKRYWQGKVATGLAPADLAASHFEANKLSADSMWDMKAGKPAVPNNKKPTALNPAPNPGNMQPAPAASQAPGKSPAPTKTPSAAFLQEVQKRISDPNKRNLWLKSKGYIIPGGQ